MRSAHAGFQLVDEEFTALVEDLVGALDKFNVPKTEKDELLGALGPLAKEIVNPPPAEAAAHDADAGQEGERQRSPSCARMAKADAADLLEVAVTARVRGQRSYAEQLYSAAERLAAAEEPGAAGAAVPRRRPRAHHDRAQDDARGHAAPSPRTSVGGSDETTAASKPKNGSLAGTMKVEGAAGAMGVIALEPASGKWKKRVAKQRVMEQRERQFAPRLLAIPVGSTVSFPNFDQIFHNVFSTSHVRGLRPRHLQERGERAT